MQAIINFFGRRRFNYVDLFALFLFWGLWDAGHYFVGVIALVALTLVSFTIEQRCD
jgi:hypothetical protein